MLAEGYRFLKKVSYKDFYIWDVKRFQDKSVIWGNKYPIVTLNKFLSEAKIEKIKIEDTKEYPILGVRTYGKGVYFNRVAKGSDLKMREYQKSQVNHLFWCKVDTKNGAFGVINEDFAESFGSTNMTYLKIDVEQIMIDYLQLFFAIEKFQRFVDNMVVGVTNRKYISKLDLLNKVTIPLPTTTEQKAIVTNYNTTLVQAEECEAKAKELEESIDKILFEELEIKESVAKKNNTFKYITNVKLSSLSRWDIWNKKEKFFSEKYTTSTLSSICSNPPLYGANEKAIKEKSDTRYIRITDINEDGSLNSDFVSATKVEEKYLLKENDFLIARSGNTVGKTFLYKEEYGKCIFAGYLIKFTLDTNKILPEYLLYYTKSFIFKDWIASNQRIFGQPNINGQEYLSAGVILPPLDIQKEISKKITKIKTEIKELRQKAESLRIKAKSDFESEVFSE